MQKARAGYRVDTGPVQFDDDWPGYFYRGDDAVDRAGLLRYAAAQLSLNVPLSERLIEEARRLEDCWDGTREKD